jgi:hypothetical protein
MAAELAHLIELFQRNGFTQAADQLRVVQTDLEAQGLIPPYLPQPGASVEAMGQREALLPSHPELTVGRSARRTLRTDYGHVRLSDECLDPHLPSALDVLALPTRLRGALLRAGCRTVDDVEFLIDQGVLRQVRDVGPTRAEQITETLRRWAVQDRAQTGHPAADRL